ncbi:MAG: LptA/OstA family protein [Tabrizicola sp.]|jgi:lipopolysaccharide export system protein LptA|nr:LptA/OstA family protein [Tabrizicola sp.]
MTLRFLALGTLAGLVAFAPMTLAQEAKIAFGDLAQDTSLPVEVTSETFSVNNADGTAVFSGDVRVTQGEMVLSATEVQVKYDPEGRAIQELIAKGGVSVTNLGDRAQSAEAVYTIDTGVIVMTGNVVLSQGPSSMQGQKLTINLKDGTGIMEGRVTTTFVPGGN